MWLWLRDSFFFTEVSFFSIKSFASEGDSPNLAILERILLFYSSVKFFVNEFSISLSLSVLSNGDANFFILAWFISSELRI